MAKTPDHLTTVAQVEALKKEARVYRRPVIGDSLFIEVHPNGGKYWRYRYRIHGVQKMLSLGVFGKGKDHVSLKKARERLADARKLVSEGIDPSAKRQQDAQGKRKSQRTLFKDIAAEWVGKQGHWAESTRVKHVSLLTTYANPWIGKKPIATVSRDDLLDTLQRLEGLDKLEAARKLAQTYQRVFRYALDSLKAIKYSPAADLVSAVKTRKAKHHAAITEPEAVGALMRAIHGFGGTLPVACALKLSPLVFVRPGELRRAEWSEIDLDAAMWRIPGNKMKMGTQHIVPLSKQAVAILREVQPLTGAGKYVFPCARSPKRPMSENAITAALRRIGYSGGEMTAHGFRGMASTLLHEQGYRTEVIERQLAHAERNKVKAAYNHAEYLPERTQMMQQWADYLDSQRDGGNVVALRGKLAREKAN